jgi:hypothetical protein
MSEEKEIEIDIRIKLFDEGSIIMEDCGGLRRRIRQHGTELLNLYQTMEERGIMGVKS